MNEIKDLTGVDAMTNPQANSLQSLNAILSENQLVELLEKHEKKINGIFSQFRLNPLATFCQKTGQPTGETSRSTLATAIALHGTERLSDIMFHANGATVHPLWIDTSPEMLDKLAELDPKGYAVYCLGLICHVDAWEQSKQRVARRAETHWQLARAWQALSFLPDVEFGKLNDTLTHALAYGAKAIQFAVRQLTEQGIVLTPDNLAMLALEYKLCQKLTDAVQNTVAETASFKLWANRKITAAERAQAGTIRGKAKGPSNIRLSNKGKRAIWSDEKQEKYKLALTMSRAFDDIFSADDAFVPGYEPWRQQTTGLGRRLNRLAPTANEAPMPDDLTAPTMFDAIFDDNLSNRENEPDNGDDGIVEIRKMSHEEARKLEREMYEEKLREHAAKMPSIPFAERIARLTTPQIVATKTVATKTPTVAPARGLLARIAKLNENKKA